MSQGLPAGTLLYKCSTQMSACLTWSGSPPVCQSVRNTIILLSQVLDSSDYMFESISFLLQKFPLESDDSVLSSTLKQFSSYLDDVSMT